MATPDVVLTAGLDVTEFNKGLQAYISGLNRMEQKTSQTAREIQQLGSAASTGIGVAMGVAAVSGIQSATRALTGLGKEVLDTLKFFESLQFSLETTIALNMSTADASLSMADALTQTGDAAQSYLLTLQDLAIFSPFTTEEIAQGNRTLQIYGLMADEALGLTRLITDLASVGGFGAERLQRISLATGQIFAEGRLLARDALQLTQAGVPILKFIENMTGQTTGQIQKLMRKGLLPANVAFEALVDGLKDFEGAGRRVAGTAQGLLSSLEDIRSITLRDLFKGVFEGIRPFMQELVDMTSAQEFRAAVTAIGEVLGQSLQRGIQSVANAVGNFIKLIRALPPETVQVIAAFAGAATALAAFGAAIGLAQVAMIALINPFTVVVGAFAGLVALFVAGQAKIAQGSVDMTNVLVENLTKMYKIFGLVADAPVDTIKGITTFTNAFSDAGAFIIRIFGNVASAAVDTSGIIIDLLSNITDWGLNVGELFASGIAAAQGAVGGALGVLGSVVSGLLRPGSPPKLLPDIDTWGRLAAEEWLKGWTNADFGILGDITKSVRAELRALVSAKDLDEVSAARILIGSRQDIANAINEITAVGRVSEDTFNKIRQSAGPAAEEVEALLRVYEDVARTTKAVEEAQAQLDEATESYKNTIEPLRKELERISELRRQGDEDAELRNLQRIIANESVSVNRKRQAQLKIQEILLGRQVRGLEKERDAVIEGGETKLEAAQKEQEAAEKALQLTQARIAAQNQQISLYGEELKALEKLERELEKLRKKLREDFLKPFEDAIKKAQLLAQEVRDTIALFKAQYTINNANSTEAEKIAAAIEQQGIEARRAKRFLELRELGVPVDEINRLREFAVTLADIGIKTDPEFGDVDLSAIAEDVTNRIEEFKQQVSDFKGAMTDARKEFDIWLGTMNDLLPPFLKFRDAAGGAGPLFRNLGAAFAGIVAIIAGNRFISVLGQLPGLILGVGTPFGLLINALSLFTAAWIADWGGIREFTSNTLGFIQQTYEDFINKGGFQQLVPDDTEFNEKLASIESAWSDFAGIFQETFSEGLSFEGIGTVLSALGSAIRSTVNELFSQDLFATIRAQIDEFINFVSSPTRLAAAFGEFYATLRQEVNAVFQQFLGDDTAGRAFTEYIQESILGSAGAFVANIPIWIGQFLGAVSDFLNNIRPQLGTIFEDFFSRVLPALLFVFGRTAGAIGSGIAELVITGLDIVFTEALPALIKNLPRILGALALGFRSGVEEAGNNIQDALILLVGGITAFIATTLGPQILTALRSAFRRAFSLAGSQAAKDIGKIIGSIKAAFILLSQVTGVLLLNIGRDLVNIIGGALRLILPGLSSAGSTILKFFGAPLRAVLVQTLTLFFTGLQKILIGLGTILSPTFNWGDLLLRVRIFVLDIISLFGRLPSIVASVANSIATGFISKAGTAIGIIENALIRVYFAFESVLGVAKRVGSAILNFGTTARNAIATVLNSIGPLAQSFSSRTFTFLESIGSVFSKAKGPARAVGGAFAEIGRQINATLKTNFLSSFTEFNKAVNSMISLLGNLSSRALTTIASQFRGLGSTITGALRGVIPALDNMFFYIRYFATTNFASSIGSQFVSLGTNLGKALQKLGPRINQITALAPGGGFLSRGPAAAAQQAVSGLGNLIRGGAGGATTGLTKVFTAIKDSNVVRAVTSLKNLGTVVRGLKTIFLGFLSPLTLVTSAIDFFAFAFNAEVDGVENRAQNFVSGLRQIWDDLISGQLWQDIVDTAREWIDIFLEVVGLISEFGFGSDEVNARLNEIGQGILDWVKGLGADIWTSIQEFWWPVFVDWITVTATNMVETLGVILNVVVGWIEAAAGWFGEKLQEWIAAFTEWWTEGGGDEKTIETLNNILTTIGGWITTAVTWIAGKLAVWIPAFINWVFETLPGLLAALGGLLLTLGAWILEQLPVLANKLLEWGAAFVNWLGPVVGETIVKLGEWIGAILKWIIGTAIPAIIKGAIGLVLALIGWISGGDNSATDEAPSKLMEFLTSIKDFFAEHILPAMLAAGISIVTAIWEGFKELWDELGGNDLLQAVQDWIDGILGTIDDWIEAGKNLIIEMVWGMTTKIFESIDTVKNKLIEILTAVGAPDFLTQWVEKGALIAKEFIFGISDGITQWVWKPVETLKEGLQSLVDSAKSLLRISSPSELFMQEIGEPIGEGVYEGIRNADSDDATKKLKDDVLGELESLKKFASKAVDQMTDAISKTFNTMAKDIAGFISDSVTEQIASWQLLALVVRDIIDQLNEDLRDMFDGVIDDILEDIKDMSDDIIPEFNTFVGDVWDEFDELESDIVGVFSGMKTDTIKEAGLMSKGLIGIFVTNEDSLVNTLRRYLIGDVATGETGEGFNIGYGFMLGIAAGFESEASYLALFNGLKDTIDKVLNAIRAEYGMKSPSEVAAKLIGEPIVEGIILGMLRTAPEFLKIVDALALRERQRLASLPKAVTEITGPQPDPGYGYTGGLGTQNIRNYNLNVNANGADSQGIIRDFATMEALS